MPTDEFKDGPGDPQWESQWRDAGSLDPADGRPLRMALLNEYLYHPDNPEHDPIKATALYLGARQEIEARDVQWYVNNGCAEEDAFEKWRAFRTQFGLDG
jgi:hypothetical protein